MILECLSFSLSNIDWTAIGAIITALMMCATFYTVFQNSKQIKELKRQWDEANRPRLYGRISNYQKAYFLEIYNAGNQDANCVDARINSEFYDNIPQEFKYIFDNMTQSPFYVKAGNSVNFFIGLCEEINKSWENLDFNIEVSGTYNNKYTLQISLPITHFINKIHLVVRTPIEKALEDISEGLVRPHLVSRPKAIQIYIRSIAENLDQLIKKYCEDGISQDK